jgi:hypothetical protein
VTHQRIQAALRRIRPLLRADGFDFELIGVSKHGVSIRLTKSPSPWAKAASKLRTEHEEVLHQEIEGFGELRVLVQRDL